MAVIGSRANGTRVPKGGGFGPASDFSQNGFFNPDAPQPASERRDVTFLGRPALPAAPEPAWASGSGFEANSLADVNLPPLDARSDLFVKSTADRVRREWFDRVAQDERALDPLAATGFAGGIKQRFEDFTTKTLGDMPETLRPHIADSLVRVGREIETRAADFETTASPVGVFNQTKQALDDISATTAHERFDAHRLLIEGQKRIQDAPLNEGSRAILSDYFLADLPVKTALSHIDDDPDDALAALTAAESRRGGDNGKARDGGGSAKAPSPGSLADGADGGDGEFDPAVFYADIAPEVRSGLKATARITSARRRESARIETTKSLEQGIAANTVTAAHIETANLDTDDKVRLHAQLKTARAEDERDAEAAERYITAPRSFDGDSPEDRAMADRGFGMLAGETDNPASALSIGLDGEAIDVIALAGKFTFHSRFMPPTAVKRLRRIVAEGTPEDSERAAAMLDEFNIPLTDAPVPPESVSQAEVPTLPPPSPPAEQPGVSPKTPVEVPEAIPEEQRQEEETSAFGVLFEVVDIVTNFVPVVSEVKAAYQAYQLSIQLEEAMERGDEAAVRQLSADLALTMTDLLPGPNIAGTIGKIGNRADRLPLIQTLKEKLQRLWNKAKGSDGSSTRPNVEGQDGDNGGSSGRVADQSSGDLPDPDDPLQDNRRREISQAKKGEEVINGIHKEDYVKRLSGDLVKRDRDSLTSDKLIAEFDNNEALAKELGGTANVRFSNDPWDREIDIVDDAFFVEAKGMASLGKDKREKIKEAFEGAKATGRRIIYHSPEAPIDSNVRIFRRYSERYGVELEIIYGKPGSLRNVRIPRLGDD